MADDPLELARALIRRPSVTPDDAGCQTLVAQILRDAGFTVAHLRFGEVDNLWAVAGDTGPLLCLAGHTDVVPPGPLEDWRFDPFAAHIEDGWLYGRGAADMKAGVAAMVCAARDFRAAHPGHGGRLAVLLTSDEEGPAIDGTRAVVEWLADQDIAIDYCLVGEPTSDRVLGDTVKNGRRGSLNATIEVIGRQGHVAYPHNADNALHRLLPLLTELVAHRWDDGDGFFDPTSFQISNLAAGTGAGNVIPGAARADCNWRFNPRQSQSSIKAHVDARCAAHGIAPEHVSWHLSGQPFVTASGTLITAVRAALADRTGTDTMLSTGGGTSDARFIAPSGAQVAELGPCNATIHQIDERIRAADVECLARVYTNVIERVLLVSCASSSSSSSR